MMKKDKKQKPKVNVRLWTEADIPALVRVHAETYGHIYDEKELYNARQYLMQLRAFPQGQFLAEIDGKIVGYATSLIVQLEDEDENYYRYVELSGGGTFSTHTPPGDTLYGADIAVHPDYRGQGVAGALYVARKRLVKKFNLRRMVAYGRIPGFVHYLDQLTPEEYVEKVKQGELKDSALNAHLKAGYEVKRVILDLLQDEESLNYCTYLVYENKKFDPQKRKIAATPLKRPNRRMRVCAAQYLMRPIQSWADLEKNVEFFVNTADTYHCHFLLLPEYFTAQMFTTMPGDWTELQMIQALANMADDYVDLFRRMAQQYGLYIIGGSHPVRRMDGYLYNVAHLFSPSGKVYTQDKLHITPSERALWNFRPGSSVKLFDTPFGRIGIQICYDIEFPEVARLMTMSGAEVIFVPFSTDEKKAYFRVRYSAQARAVENYIYTVISGNAGNLPTRSYLLNYAQSAILTPSDFAFPMQAVAAEADPNVETVVIAELDLTNLAKQREVGSVRPLFDRRQDLYDLKMKKPIEIILVD